MLLLVYVFAWLFFWFLFFFFNQKLMKECMPLSFLHAAPFTSVENQQCDIAVKYVDYLLKFCITLRLTNNIKQLPLTIRELSQ